MSFLCTAYGRLRVVSHAWRVFAVGLGFVVFGTLGLAAAIAFGLFVPLIPKISAATRRQWARSTIRALSLFFVELIRYLGLYTYRVERIEGLDASGTIIVANHPSLIDALLVGAFTPNVCCVVKPALYSNPFTSYLVRTAGYLRSDSPTLIDDAVAAVNSGENLLLFPEGTRNLDDKTLAFRRGAAHVALQAKAPLLPVSIDFYPRAMQKGQAWYELPSEPSRVIIRVLPALDPWAGLDADLPVTLAARRLTHRLRELYVAEVNRFAIHCLPSSTPSGLPGSIAQPAIDTLAQPVTHQLPESVTRMPAAHSSLDRGAG